MYSSNIRPGLKDKGNYGNQKVAYKPIKNKYIKNLEKKNDLSKNLLDLKLDLTEKNEFHKQDFVYQTNLNLRTRINVSGKHYELQNRLIQNFPKSLLGCKKDVCAFYDSRRDEYFFDRSREAFEGVVSFYQTLGEFHVPMFLPVEIYYEEIKFFRLDQYLSSDSTSDHELLNIALDEQYLTIKNKFNSTKDKTERNLLKKEIGNLKRRFNSVNYYYDIDDDLEEKKLPLNKHLRFLWLLFEKPNSTWLGSIIAFICLITILVSIISMCVETMWKTNDSTDVRLKQTINNTSTISAFTRSDDEFNFFPDVRLKAFYIIEFICNTIFTLEISIRAISAPNKTEFFKSFANLIDLVSIIPFWFTLFINNVNFFYSKLFHVVISNSKTKLKTNQYGLSFLKILRLTRILRVFKLSRHIRTMKIMGEILRECAFEIVLLLTFLAINIVIFSSLIYYIELYSLEDKSPFISIPHSFWWAVISFTTIGYGDLIPQSRIGKFFGSFFILFGILIALLPVPILSCKFERIYNEFSQEHKDKRKKSKKN